MDNQLTNQLTASMSAMLLLNSSCQGIVETYITQPDTAADWYTTVSSKLNAAQRLVRDWRLSGNLYFNQDILTQIISCSQTITGTRNQVEGLFSQLAANYDETIKNELLNILQTLKPSINALNTSISNYASQLKAWDDKIEKVHEDLNLTIKQIQAQEAKIQNEIQLINQQIASMQQEIDADRKAISDARAEETKGIFETIFGVLLVPVTGGLSLILAGIGVSSIAEAEAKVSSLSSTISRDKDSINSYQNQLTDDQKQIASLNLILMTVGLAANDCASIVMSLDAVQTTIGSLLQEIEGVIDKITKATTADEVIMEKVWYEASCNEWASILAVAQTLKTSTPATQNLSI